MRTSGMYPGKAYQRNGGLLVETLISVSISGGFERLRMFKFAAYNGYNAAIFLTFGLTVL